MAKSNYSQISGNQSPSNFKMIPNFKLASERHTIFSSLNKAKSIIGHYPGRPEVNEKRFESPSPLFQDSQYHGTGVRPRKLSLNINFSKPTNRDGAKLLILRPMKQPPLASMKSTFIIDKSSNKVSPFKSPMDTDRTPAKSQMDINQN